jgi:hypothetical protein
VAGGAGEAPHHADRARSGPERAGLAAIETASMALARSHVRGAGADRAPDDRGAVRRGADDDQQPGGVWAQIVLIGLKWFCTEIEMSVVVQVTARCGVKTLTDAAGVVSRLRVAFAVDRLLFVRAASAPASFSASP